jgi:pyruvate dehydrogenase E1 component beta subunit
MKRLGFVQAIESALAQAMAEDERVVIMGEDVQMIRVNLFTRFGKERVFNTPISESAFLGAAVSAAMSGIKPVVEIMLVDFIGVAMDAVLNHAAKIRSFSGGDWNVPLVIRTACGGGYGDGGQHEQSLWGWLAHIPGVSVLVPSTPADAGGLMLTAIEHEDPVVYFEHKLLTDNWLDYMGGSSRKTVKFDVPAEGAHGPVPKKWEAIPMGQAVTRRDGKDITIVSVAVGVHRSLEAAEVLGKKGVDATVIDLRSVSPLDKEMVCESVARTGRLIVVDEDYKEFGLSGELAAVIKEEGITCEFARVCTEDTIPYARDLEDQTLPSTEKIVKSALRLMEKTNS